MAAVEQKVGVANLHKKAKSLVSGMEAERPRERKARGLLLSLIHI